MLRVVGILLRGWWPAVLVPLAACFAPQEIELFEDPTVYNQPPIIDVRTASPVRPTCISRAVDESVEQPTLRALVTDPNGGDGQRLEARWFVDYQPGVSRTLSAIGSQALPPLRLGDEFSYPPLELSADILLRFSLEAGLHQVEVVVSDGFDDGAEPRNRAPSLGNCSDLEGPCYVTSHKWIVELKDNSPCPE